VKKRRGCVEWIAIVACVLAVLALVTLGIYAFLRLRQEQLLAQSLPPSVTITYPPSGTHTLAGSYLPVSATASGAVPITRAELWVDGQLIDTQESRVPEGVSPFYASFDLTVPQGLHTLFVRAADATGLLGDSWPVNVGGVERPDPDEPALVVTVETGETLEEIAATHDVDPETVRQLNPGLGDQEPPEGSEVVLPPPRSQAAVGPEGQVVGPTLPTGEEQPPPGTGTLAPPTGQRLGVISAASPISFRPILDLLAAGAAPTAPTDLQAEVAGCNVRLSWTDNADNEERYEVKYVWSFSQDARVIAELEPAAGGQVYFEFPAPSEGVFLFWVEAVNFWGGQPSNIVGPVFVEGDCPQTLATHLQVEALDMTVPGDYDRIYCYLSFEGAPHMRVPNASFFDDFVAPVAAAGETGPWDTGSRTLAVPIPGDGSLEVQGECWGWSGNGLSELGECSGIYPRETWDGTRTVLQGRDFSAGVAIKPVEGALDTSGEMTTFSYDDPSIPVPYDVFEDMVRSPFPIAPLTRSVSWKWDGDPETISGFQVLLNGVPYNTSGGLSLVDSIGRSALVRLPQECGGHISWQVRAVAGEAQSALSALAPDNDYDLPHCPHYAMVRFYGMQFEEDCDFYPAWWLSVNGQVKEFNASCDTGAFTGCLIRGLDLSGNCGPHYFADWGAGMDPYPDTIVVPISLEQMDVEVKVAVWDRVSGEMRAALYQPWTFTSLDDLWYTVGCGKHVDYWAFGPTLWYDLYVIPPPEGEDCDVTQPAYIP